jgi:hypothetical protein
MRTSPGLVRCKLSLEALQSLEDRLRALDAFLADQLQRRRQRRPLAATADGAGLPAAKRQRLEDAQQAELKRWVAGRDGGWCGWLGGMGAGAGGWAGWGLVRVAGRDGGGCGWLGRRALAKHVKPSQRNCQAYCLRCLCPPPPSQH